MPRAHFPCEPRLKSAKQPSFWPLTGCQRTPVADNSCREPSQPSCQSVNERIPRGSGTMFFERSSQTWREERPATEPDLGACQLLKRADDIRAVFLTTQRDYWSNLTVDQRRQPVGTAGDGFIICRINVMSSGLLPFIEYTTHKQPTTFMIFKLSRWLVLLTCWYSITLQFTVIHVIHAIHVLCRCKSTSPVY